MVKLNCSLKGVNIINLPDNVSNTTDLKEFLREFVFALGIGNSLHDLKIYDTC